MREVKPRVVIAVDEPTYSGLWYEPPDRRQPATPRVSPPPVKGEKPKVIPYRSVIDAKPVYLYPVDWENSPYPRVVQCPTRLLRSARSAVLGPNAYLFAGEIVAQDRYLLRAQDGRSPSLGRLVFVVDCGVPLIFRDVYKPDLERVKVICPETYVRVGNHVAGLARLSAAPMGLVTGLFQPVRARVRGMRVLGLDPNVPSFGQVRRVPFGTRLPLDPDFVHIGSVFAELEVDAAGPISYKPFPARHPDHPEPDLSGVVRLDDEPQWRVVPLGFRLPCRS